MSDKILRDYISSNENEEQLPNEESKIIEIDLVAYEELKTDLENLKNIVFRILDFNFPELDAKFKYYDFITNEVVKHQLELDFLRMQQVPASNFDKYCYFSFFQIENLLNYYYTLRFKTNEAISKYFKFNNRRYTRISEIPYASKFVKYADEFLQKTKYKQNAITGQQTKKLVPTPLNYDIQKIAYIRNASIHRNSASQAAEEETALKKYHIVRQRKEDGKTLTKEEWEIFNIGNRIEFRNKESFATVKKRTLEFIENIKPEILKYQSANKN